MKQNIDKKFSVPTIYDDAYLTCIEGTRHVPFAIKRIYIIHHCLPRLDRGHHAHKKTHQVIFCLQGSFDLLLDDGKVRKTLHVDKPHIGEEIPPLVWHEMKHISKDAILLVVASHYYDEKDYIRKYETFRSYVKRKK